MLETMCAWADTAICDERWDEMNDALHFAEISAMDTEDLCGLVTFTIPVREHLTYHAAFVEYVLARVAESESAEDYAKVACVLRANHDRSMPSLRAP